MSMGGWTRIVNRIESPYIFEKYYADYVNGFGDLETNNWLGLQSMRDLLESADMELMIEASDEKEKKFLHYGTFKIGPASDGYRLKLGSLLNSNIYDGASSHNGKIFNTIDKGESIGCAKKFRAGWWYENSGQRCFTTGFCLTCNPIEIFNGANHSRFSSTKMLIRPKQN